MNKTTFVRLVSCVALVFAAGCSAVPAKPVAAFPPALTRAIFDELKVGMSYGEAVVVLGRDGSPVSTIIERGIKSVLYTWQGEGFKQITAMFRDGKLVNKYAVELQ